jgi:penicillin-binding protein-related factor A (putative recombinase)
MNKSRGNDGKIFEKSFKDSVPKDAYYYRVKDSANSWSSKNEDNKTRFTPKNEFDSILFRYPTLLILELKSTKGTAFSFKGSSPMIKEHQIKELEKASKYTGVHSGFVFNFREPEETYFMYICDFLNFCENTSKSSINKNDIINNNGILIDSKLKIKHYKYDIDKFLNELN